MRNWSVDVSQFDKQSNEYITWRLEQLINFGLQGEKINKSELEKFLPQLTIDPMKRSFLEFLLYKNAATN